MHILEADGIRFEINNHILLSSVYVKCETQKITGLFGRNGAGKSCLLNIIYGTLDTMDKSIRIDGSLIKKPHVHPEIIRYLPQFHFIPGNMCLKQILKDFEINKEDFLSDFPEFDGKINQRVAGLSGGEKRLVEVYTIVKANSNFVLLDEPFSYLMPLHIEKLKEIIIVEKANKGFLITDHLYKSYIKLCDSFYVLKDGKTNLANGIEDIENYGYAVETE